VIARTLGKLLDMLPRQTVFGAEGFHSARGFAQPPNNLRVALTLRATGLSVPHLFGVCLKRVLQQLDSLFRFSVQ
jgi:hypothetical protein